MYSPLEYADVIPYLDTAMENGGLEITFANNATAIRFVQRANAWRVRDRKNDKEGISRYDLLVIGRPNNGVVRIRERDPMKATAIKTLDGRVLGDIYEARQQAYNDERYVRPKKLEIE